jgi:hypothetical protein
MAKKCPICSHSKVVEINMRLLNRGKTGETFKMIAKEYQNCSETNIKRHYYNHLQNPESSGNSSDEIDLDNIIKQAEINSWRAYYAAQESGDVRLAQSSLSNALKCYEIRKKEEKAGESGRDFDIKNTVEWTTLQNRLIIIFDSCSSCKAKFIELMEG